MAIPSGALTLEQILKYQNPPQLKTIVDSLYRFESVLPLIPMVTAKVDSMSASRFDNTNVPAPSFRRLNEEPQYLNGDITPYNEKAYIVRDFVGVDRLTLENERNYTDPLQDQMDMVMEGFTYKMNDYFINANPTTVEDSGEIGVSPIGLKHRLDNPAAFGVALNDAGTAAATKIDAASDVRLSALTSTVANTFLEAFGRMVTRMGSKDGKGIHAFMDEDMYERFPSIIGAANQGRGFSVDKDNFDREVMKWRNVQLHRIGRKKDGTTRIIPITEGSDGTGTSGDYTSIYFAHMAPNKFFGWHWGTPRFIRQPGQDNGIIQAYLFEYVLGWMMGHNRSIGRLYDIRLGTIS